MELLAIAVKRDREDLALTQDQLEHLAQISWLRGGFDLFSPLARRK